MSAADNSRTWARLVSFTGQVVNAGLSPFGVRLIRKAILPGREIQVEPRGGSDSAIADSSDLPSGSLPAFSVFRYQQINNRRLEHLSSLGLDLQGSSVLEVGAGVGDLTGFFVDRGCRVVSTDGRQENVDAIRSRFPQVTALQMDLENPVDIREVFDIVFCYGVLYHLGRPAQAIEFLAKRCSKLLLLETRVSYGPGEAVNICNENAAWVTESMSGRGCRPTRQWVFKRLKRHFDYVYMPTTQPWHEQFPIDWTLPPAAPEASIRSIYVASRDKLHNSLLIEAIPLEQTRQ